MNFDAGSVSAICAGAAVIGAVAMRFYQWAFGEGKVATQSHAVETLVTAAIGKIDLLVTALNEHKIEDARNFAKLETLGSENARAQVAAEHRIAGALEGFGREIGEMNKRIDRVLERRDSD